MFNNPITANELFKRFLGDLQEETFTVFKISFAPHFRQTVPPLQTCSHCFKKISRTDPTERDLDGPLNNGAPLQRGNAEECP